MTLPLHLQMEIDLAAQMHHKEIAEAFFEIRAADPDSLAAMVNRAMRGEPAYNAYNVGPCRCSCENYDWFGLALGLL